MTKEELEKATGEELIDARDYCGVDGYYGEYLKDVNEEMLKRFNQLAELEEEVTRLRNENLDIINKYTGFAETDRRTIAELEEKLVAITTDRDRWLNVDKEDCGHLKEAKEIIKDLLGSENQYCEEEMFFTIRKRAEDFIKE